MVKLAFEFSSLSFKENNDDDSVLDVNTVSNNKTNDPTSTVTVEFDCENFYKFIRYEVNNQNVGKMLQLMKESIEHHVLEEKSQAVLLSYRKSNH